MLDHLALQPELARPFAHRLLEFGADESTGARDHRARLDRVLGAIAGGLDGRLLVAGRRIGLLPAVSLIVPMTQTHPRRDSVSAEHPRNRLAGRAKSLLGGGIGEEQVSVVGDHDVSRHLGLDLLREILVPAQAADQIAQHATGCRRVQLGLQAPVPLAWVDRHLARHRGREDSLREMSLDGSRLLDSSRSTGPAWHEECRILGAGVVFVSLAADTCQMSPSLVSLRFNRRLMAYTASAIYGAAAFDGGVDGLLPSDPSFSVTPILVALAIALALLPFGPRLPRRWLAPLGPLGVALIAYALATTPGAGDGAVLYMWPVLWMTFFFGRRGAMAVIACVGVAHAAALLSLPAASSYPGRWVDVMICVSVVAGVTLTLVHRNEALLSQLAAEARIDPLTGLLNRRGFDERAPLELAHARREDRPIALAAFDIDYFKCINDEWGHEIGDRVLARAGELLAAQSREIDVAARTGGEEFTVLLPGSDGSDADAFTQRVRAALAASDPSGLPTVRVSAGILASDTPTDIETMLRGADTALYKAKRGGRNRTVTISTDHVLY